MGFSVDVLPVTAGGIVDLEVAERIITGATGLISVATANHEIGVVQPIAEISAMARHHGALFHSDLAQAAGKIDISCEPFDLASLSSHKFCGPGGVGALFVKRLLKPRLNAHMVGGGQESGLRSGTLAVPLCVAFGEACAIAIREMTSERERVGALRDMLLSALLAIPGATLNGVVVPRLPGNINVRFDEVDGEALAFQLQNVVSISTGSACSAKSLEPSPVLLAMGLARAQAENSIRIGIGRFTTIEEIVAAADAINAGVADLRATRRRA